MPSTAKNNFEIALGTSGLCFVFISFYLSLNVNFTSWILSLVFFVLGAVFVVKYKAFDVIKDQNLFAKSEKFSNKDRKRNIAIGVSQILIISIFVFAGAIRYNSSNHSILVDKIYYTGYYILPLYLIVSVYSRVWINNLMKS